ncbi:hypothetical protein Vretifemale_190, partial [Volvox reticuliferus]
AADVYSFGVLLWQMYTGLRPWAGMNTGQIVYNVGMKAMQLPFPSDTPTGLLAVSRACTAADPRKRPTFVKVQEDLLAMAGEVGLEVDRRNSLVNTGPGPGPGLPGSGGGGPASVGCMTEPAMVSSADAGAGCTTRGRRSPQPR